VVLQGSSPQLGLRASARACAPPPSLQKVTVEVDVGGVKGVGHVNGSLLGGPGPVHVAALCVGAQQGRDFRAGWELKASC
jgi:hypothetical protein